MKTIKQQVLTNGITVEGSLSDMRLYHSSKQKILVCGHVYYSARVPYLYSVLKEIPNTEIIVLCENGSMTYDRLYRDNYPGLSKEEKEKIKFFIVPDMFIKDSFHEFETNEVSLEQKLYIKRKAYLNEAVKNLTSRHKNMEKSYAQKFAIDAERYVNEFLEILQPKIVVIWNQFHAFHHVLDAICKKKKIQTVYYEYGALPGTYALENKGQMGESYPAIKYEEFRDLPVSDDDIRLAKKVWDYLKESKINRKKQPVNNELSILKEKLKKGRPTFFYAGQNDYESGLYPYTRNTKQRHSPLFKSSDKAAIVIAKICKKNNWNFIYKRHPLISKFSASRRMPSNVLLFDDIDITDVIEVADVTMTILSQTGYVSTIQKKPTIMLGYMQLRGKDCTYEAFKKRDIEKVMRQALEEGFTDKQEQAFVKHIAQLNKYYLFNDPYVERDLYYGRSIEECREFFVNNFNQAIGKKIRKDKICTCNLLINNFIKAARGRQVWRTIYDAQDINLGLEHIIIIPEEELEVLYYSMLYLDEYLKRIRKEKVIVITDCQLVCDTISLFTQYVKSISKVSKKQMDNLLKYQIVFGNTSITTVASLKRYTGRLCEGLIGKEKINVEELVAVGIYDLSFLYHAQGRRASNINEVYRKIYFNNVDNVKEELSVDISQQISLVESMVTKRGTISFCISGNVANLVMYLNKKGKNKNIRGAQIPPKYSPMKDIMTVASTFEGTNYMVTIKRNGEMWFNFCDGKNCPILLNCAWIIRGKDK